MPEDPKENPGGQGTESRYAAQHENSSPDSATQEEIRWDERLSREIIRQELRLKETWRRRMRQIGGGRREGMGEEPGRGERKWRGILRSEEHTSELQSHSDLVCRLLLE